MKANVPVLAEEEVWNRNKYFKHWGHYKTFRFRKGKPTIIIASCIYVTIRFQGIACNFIYDCFSNFDHQNMEVSERSYHHYSRSSAGQLYTQCLFFKAIHFS
jgi:hypothetical protein